MNPACLNNYRVCVKKKMLSHPIKKSYRLFTDNRKIYSKDVSFIVSPKGSWDGGTEIFGPGGDAKGGGADSVGTACKAGAGSVSFGLLGGSLTA